MAIHFKLPLLLSVNSYEHMGQTLLSASTIMAQAGILLFSFPYSG